MNTRLLLLFFWLMPSCLSGDTLTSEVSRRHRAPNGVCVVVPGDPSSVASELSQSCGYVIQSLHLDEDSAVGARNGYARGGLAGRVTAKVLYGSRLPYVDNLVNTIVVEDPRLLDDRGLGMAELMRVLMPRGQLYVRDSVLSRSLIGDAARLTKVRRLDVDGQSWSLIRKEWPSELDEWNHELHGADGNPVSHDQVVGPPRGFQWIADPKWDQGHETQPSISAIVTAQEYLVFIENEMPTSMSGDNGLPEKWFLKCRNAFNGVLLWKMPMEGWGMPYWGGGSWFIDRATLFPVNLARRLVAVDDRIFVTLGYDSPVSKIDAKTGTILATYSSTKGANEIVVQDGSLVCSVVNGEDVSIAKIETASDQVIWSLDRKFDGARQKAARSGKISAIRRHKPALNLAHDGEVVCFNDQDSVVCLDSTDGKVLWKTRLTEDDVLYLGALIIHNSVVLYADEKSITLLDKKNGKKLGTATKSHFNYGTRNDLFIINGEVHAWSHERDHSEQSDRKKGNFGGRSWPLSLDARSLDTLEKVGGVDLGRLFVSGHHHRCHRNRATDNYILAGRRGIEFVSLKDDKHSINNYIRGECHVGNIPANGLVYSPPHSCRCRIFEVLTWLKAVSPRSMEPSKSEQDALVRLVKGPCYGEARRADATGDWPRYRGNDALESCSQASITTDVTSLWQTKIGDGVTPATIAEGLCFVSDPDSHTLHALDMETGNTSWTFLAAGKVDSPPTYAYGRLYFGSRGGDVYCLDALTGRLAWKHLIAPGEGQMCCREQIESVWPVHGSLLVSNGIVYAAAGRSSYLDGGVRVIGLDAHKGHVVYSTQLRSEEEYSKEMTENDPQRNTIDNTTAKNGLIRSHGGKLYLNQLGFSDNLVLETAGVFPSLQANPGYLDPNYYKRAPWSVGAGKAGVGMNICRDESRAYVLKMWKNFKSMDPQNYFTPGKSSYQLAAVPVDSSKAKSGRWQIDVPVRVTSLLATQKHVIIGGPPNILDPADPLGALEGRKGGAVFILDKQDGAVRSETRLASPPVLNCISVAPNRIVIVSEDGHVSCCGTR